ncbi:caspase family protein [Rhodoblastus acidophilus]|uniref:Caspase family protein n=1 Tax=Candidatus Rhodoblastus alkanivorans TaxID=2954117 RepID=A0ABS9Z856_9HYPH|nr:caspase family protein [Candidatus Rhodoblastus alkanivorans]MCI4678292.1 caspase family protein [Candidatus Rhodoblastus alkanivorans]MCI4683550.1 caspase family protein [Candidatus Rhodoblastus alkanivorans]MDI4640865.1 caspase family protein [Rhodoblastus acidophilus]
MKPRYFFGIIIASFVAGVVGVAIAWADEQRVALVVGNGNYKSINRLVNPTNDAEDMARALRKVGFEVILRTDLTKDGFDKALAEFARKAAGASAALFYYAGHGVAYQQQNYILPVDIEVRDQVDLQFRAIEMPHVMEAFDRVPGVKIVMLDTCRDNPLDRRFAGVTRSIQDRGLARIDASEGFVIAYATSPNHTAQDGTDHNSPFTDAFIHRLAEPDLEIATLFRRVTQDVYEQTNGRQRPEVSISLIGDFYLNPITSDAQAWSRIADSTQAADFERFIQSYPQSSHIPEARRKLEIFAKIELERDQRLLQQSEDQARALQKAQQEKADQEQKRLDALRQAREEVERRALQEQATRREADREAVERLIKERLGKAQPAPASAADATAVRSEVERLAEKNRQERQELEIAAERYRLHQLILHREKAAGAEADRLDAEIRDLVRKQVERIAAQRLQRAGGQSEVRETAGGVTPKPAPEPVQP